MRSFSGVLLWIRKNNITIRMAKCKSSYCLTESSVQLNKYLSDNRNMIGSNVLVLELYLILSIDSNYVRIYLIEYHSKKLFSTTDLFFSLRWLNQWNQVEVHAFDQEQNSIRLSIIYSSKYGFLLDEDTPEVYICLDWMWFYMQYFDVFFSDLINHLE